MALRSVKSTSELVGRRTWSRLRVRLPAKIQTHSQSGNAVLNDVSKSGARVTPSFAMRLNQECVLTWCGNEIFGRVVWERRGQCGIAFDRPISETVLCATRDINERDGLSEQFDAIRDAAREWASGVGRL